MTTADPGNELLPHLFRTEYSGLTAALCRLFGIRHIEIAEDIASEVFLKATEQWSVHGIPDNPSAWLYTVAKNKARDYFRHQNVREQNTDGIRQSSEAIVQPDFELNKEYIADSQLAMLFAVCHASNSREAQICLSLQILCGFSVEEIAGAFLTNRETIKKRLFRARNNLRNSEFNIAPLLPEQIGSRQKTVMRTLYLLFNEGYFSRNESLFIRKDLCSEAIRLTLLLTENPLTNTPAANALLALMCFQSSRLNARINEVGTAVLFDEQDRKLWDRELIEKGNYYLIRAVSKEALSAYHLEAAIAYWHTTEAGDEKWEHILQLYNRLLQMNYSPVTELNRLFALAKARGKQQALAEIERFPHDNTPSFHSLLGFLYCDDQPHVAIEHYRKALKGAISVTERKTLGERIRQLEKGKESGE